MRKNVIAGNWKMHKTPQEALAFLEALGTLPVGEDRVILCAPFLCLQPLKERAAAPVEIAAQNMHYADQGAFTGEISASMLKAVDIHMTILGHSERRHDFGESDEMIQKKVDQALAHEMEVILCVGELLEERDAGREEEVVKGQLESALAHVKEAQMARVMIAYEPVWAIGTGKTASAKDAQTMCAFLRDVLEASYGKQIAEQVSILYGGSVKPANIVELMNQTDIDGVLVGGASLTPESFSQLVDYRNQA